MDVIVERVAGLDVSKSDVKACVRCPRQGAGRRYGQEVRTFATMTRQLMALADWLAESHVELVVMEATGDYWKPVFYQLEERFTVWLVNARDVKKVPVAKPTSRMPNGSPSWRNTGWSRPRSCRRRPSAGYEISPGSGSTSSGNGCVRCTGWRAC